MPRPVILYSGAFIDRPLTQLAEQAASWGYAGFELVNWGGHFDAGVKDFSKQLEALADHELQIPVVAAFRTSQVIGDRIDTRHRGLVSAQVWGDGQPEGVRRRAIEELIATIRAAARLGASVVSGFTGSPLWSFVNGYPGPSPALVEEDFQAFSQTWQPILDVCSEVGVRYALEVHPGQMAFDYYSAERTLEALEGRPEFGFCVDPAHLHWQGMDPAEFVRHFGERIYHVHMKDVFIHLDGRSSLLNSYLPYGDARRGWEFRSPGRGGVAWEEFIRALNHVNYDGPLSVDWRDEALDPDFGAKEACEFVKRLDFPRRD